LVLSSTANAVTKNLKPRMSDARPNVLSRAAADLFQARARWLNPGLRLDQAEEEAVRDIVRLVVAQGMRPVVLGIAVGIGAALAFGRLLSSLVYGISASDPATYAAVAALLGAVALAACLVPARQATRIGGIRALRED